MARLTQDLAGSTEVTDVLVPQQRGASADCGRTVRSSRYRFTPRGCHPLPNNVSIAWLDRLARLAYDEVVGAA